jgi:hypothetical protein
MDPLHLLMVNTVACFEKVLGMLCTDKFNVAADPTPGSLALIAMVSDADKAALMAEQTDVALEKLADGIGVHSGIAQVSFQLG